jgi:hypothetical protein
VTTNGPFQLADENGDNLGFFTSGLDESGALIVSSSVDDAIALSATYDSLVTLPTQLRISITVGISPRQLSLY